MPIHGTLSSMPLADLLGWISQSRKSGTLEIRFEKGLRTLAFEHGSLIYSASWTEDGTLGRLLVDKGIVSEDAYRSALGEREKRSVAVAKVLHEAAALSAESAIRFLRKKAERELFDLFKSGEGDFFFDDLKMPQIDMLPIRLDLEALLPRIMKQLREREEYDFDSSGTHLQAPGAGDDAARSR